MELIVRAWQIYCLSGGSSISKNADMMAVCRCGGSSREVFMIQPKLENHVKRVYENFTASEISAKVAQLVKPECLNGTTEANCLSKYRNLHEALTDHSGDWYFTGNYPTPGGYRVVHKAFLNFYENKDGRSY